MTMNILHHRARISL